MRSNLKLSNNGKKFLSGIIILVVLLFLVFGNKKDVLINEIAETDNFLIKIDYPEVDNKKIASEMRKYIDDKKMEFINLVKELDSKEFKYEFLTSYSLSTKEDITSVHIVIYAFTGGAHYTREDKSYYFNKNGDLLSLKDFLVNDEALEKLSKAAYYQIMMLSEKHKLDLLEEMVKEGTEPNLDNFMHFNFKGDGMELLFPPYQVASWADGEIKIVIPYNELKDIILDKYLDNIKKEDNVSNEKRSLEEFKDKKLIAFTFDDGPSNGPTNKLLDNLDKYKARVTFFVLGSRVNQYRSSLLKAYKQGNQIGSHTYSHLNLYKLNDYDILREVKSTNKVIKEITGEDTVLLRPPYGNINNEIKALTDMYTILWNVDTLDWKYKDKYKIADNIIKNAHDGAIVLLHDIYESSVDGALLAMEKLQDDGYAFVTIEEMAFLKNIKLDKTKSYFGF